MTTQEDIKKEYGIDYYVNPKQTQESVAEIANKLNISVIKIESDDPTIFIKVDGHWNAKGNKMISEKLFSELKPLIEKEQSKNS